MPDSGPPDSLRKLDSSFARRYRVDVARTTLREFRNLSGRPIVGVFAWCALRVGLMRMNWQVLDGPRPFAEDQCDLEDLQDPVRTHVLAIAETAGTLGFHSPVYSMANSTGVDVHGGTIRMLHESHRWFLQIIASSSGTLLRGYEILVSAIAAPPKVFATTNGPPNYNSPPGVRATRCRGAGLEELVARHAQSLTSIDGLMRFRSFEDVGQVVDHLSCEFYADKIARRIFVPEISPEDLCA